MEVFIFMGMFGAVLIFAGYKGMQYYARAISDNPKATISSDMLLALLSGPAVVPAVMCLMSIIGGVWLIGTAISIILSIGYQSFK